MNLALNKGYLSRVALPQDNGPLSSLFSDRDHGRPVADGAYAKELFLRGGNQVKRSNEATEIEIFGRVLTDREIYQLSGAAADAEVKVGGCILEKAAILSMRTISNYFSRQQYYVEKKEGQKNLIIQNIAVEDAAPLGYGTFAFAAQVFASRRLGIDTISLTSVGNRNDIEYNSGYYVWARYGFDAPLKRDEISSFPDDFHAAKTVQDILSHGRPGADCWRKYGSGRSMSFDLREGALSLEVFRAYLAEKQISIRI